MHPRCFVSPRCLEYTVRLTGRCIPVPLSGTVFEGTGTVFTFGPTVLPVRNPRDGIQVCAQHNITADYLSPSLSRPISRHSQPMDAMEPALSLRSLHRIQLACRGISYLQTLSSNRLVFLMLDLRSPLSESCLDNVCAQGHPRPCHQDWDPLQFRNHEGHCGRPKSPFQSPWACSFYLRFHLRLGLWCCPLGGRRQDDRERTVSSCPCRDAE